MLFSLIYRFFLVKLLKFQKMSDWNELSSITGKWKFCRIYWQRILKEQTSLYTVVYRTFLYNPTNLKVPKKAPCWGEGFRGRGISRWAAWTWLHQSPTDWGPCRLLQLGISLERGDEPPGVICFELVMFGDDTSGLRCGRGLVFMGYRG